MSNNSLKLTGLMEKMSVLTEYSDRAVEYYGSDVGILLGIAEEALESARLLLDGKDEVHLKGEMGHIFALIEVLKCRCDYDFAKLADEYIDYSTKREAKRVESFRPGNAPQLKKNFQEEAFMRLFKSVLDSRNIGQPFFQENFFDNWYQKLNKEKQCQS